MNSKNEMEFIHTLTGFPDETEWIEFKGSFNNAEKTGKDISALANSAAYYGRDFAYKLWGIADGDHSLEGTSFNPYREKAKSNQDLQIWLQRMLTPNANYEFKTIAHDGLRFVALQICAAVDQPVRFEQVAYIRHGSSTTKLVAGSAKEAELWRRLQRACFESKVAENDLQLEEIPAFLSIDLYYELNG